MPPRINIPPVTRGLLAVLVLQSFLSAAIRYRQWSATSEIVIPYLTLIPQLSLIYPWTFLTSTLVENNIFTLGIAGVTIYHGGRYLERAWSSAELAKFVAITALIPNTLTFATMIVFFTLTRNERWTYVELSLTKMPEAPRLTKLQIDSPSLAARFRCKYPSSSLSVSSSRRTLSPSSVASSPCESRDSRSCTSELSLRSP